MLPPSGRLNLNSGGLDDQLRALRPPGYRAGQGSNAFGALSAANLSQETGFGNMTQIGSNMNFGPSFMPDNRQNNAASIDIKELNAILNLDLDDDEAFQRKTGRNI